MKQLPMTPELSALIKERVGEDVDTATLAVFEARALNTKPLHGKDGTIFEKAVVFTVTLVQMVDYILSGKHLPLIADHELFGAPKGRFFHAGLFDDEDGKPEMRVLFYLDATEEKLITKLNSGSLDEVSVSFLSSAFLCSECKWDYFQFGTRDNIDSRTCANDHTIGEDGVHAEMIGLNKFLELSLVAAGAADTPKIVGHSEAKLAPNSVYRLAAKGFETNALVVQASMGKEDNIMADATNTDLMRDLVESKTAVATLTADVSARDKTVASLTTERDTATGRVTELEAELKTAKAETKVPEDYEPTKAALAVAATYLQEQVNHLLVAGGKPKLEGEALPADPTELKAKISELTDNLTSILPVGGKAVGATGASEQAAQLSINPDAFRLRK